MPKRLERGPSVRSGKARAKGRPGATSESKLSSPEAGEGAGDGIAKHWSQEGPSGPEWTRQLGSRGTEQAFPPGRARPGCPCLDDLAGGPSFFFGFPPSIVVVVFIKLEWTPLRRQVIMYPNVLWACISDAGNGLSRRGIASRYRQVFVQSHTVGGWVVPGRYGHPRAAEMSSPRAPSPRMPAFVIRSPTTRQAGRAHLREVGGILRRPFRVFELVLRWQSTTTLNHLDEVTNTDYFSAGGALVKFRGRYCLVLASNSSPDDVALNAGKLKIHANRRPSNAP